MIKFGRLRWVDDVARKKEGRDAFKMLTGKPTGKRPLGRSRCIWEESVRNDVEEIGIHTRNWVDLA